MTKFILAIDQGTTSSRALLFDLDGKPVAIKQKEFNNTSRLMVGLSTMLLKFGKPRCGAAER